VKTHLNDLAIAGGSPGFGQALHVGRPNIGDRRRLLERIDELLDRGWLTNNGPYVQEFERRISDALGVKHCIAMCNATVALQVAIRALGLEGEVIIPSFTFVATAHALQWQKIVPVFCDIDPKTHNIDPHHVETMITSRTTGLIGVHLWGRPCDINQLSEIAKRNHLRLLFDAAHAFGSSYKGTMIGNFGDAEIFSFHATKFLNTFEGGAVATNNDELAARIRLMKNFGFSGVDDLACLGTNAKMSEVSAVMGLTGLESLNDFISVNRRNYKQYQRELASVPGVKMLSFDENEQSNYQYIVVEIDERVAHLSRDQLLNVLSAENVMAQRYFYPGCHRMEPYRSDSPHAGSRLLETEELVKRVLQLPTGTAVGAEAISTIGQIIRTAVAHGEDVRARMKARGSSESVR